MKKYLGRTSADNVRNDIESAFEYRDVAWSDSILDAGFVFRFAAADISSGPPDSLIRGDLLAALQHLFVSGVAGDNPAASRITLNITAVTITDDARIGHAGWKKYSVNTALRINFPNGSDLQVDSPAELFFRQSAGGRWTLAEWRDITSGAPQRRSTVTPADFQAARPTTWGSLFWTYH